MQETSFEQAVEQARARDPRYARDSYLFVREALDHTQQMLNKQSPEKGSSRGKSGDAGTSIHHVTGQQLLEGIRAYALEQYGPMALTVLEEWGVRNCTDFGEIVFNMVETGLLAKTEKDSRDDFTSGYDFEEAFRKPFIPVSKVQATKAAEPETE